MTFLYAAVRRFDPHSGESWKNYIQWAGLNQLKEVITLDLMLCPNFFDELSAEDWQYNVQRDFQTDYFLDLDYVLAKTAGNNRLNILALIQEPTDLDLQSFTDPRFVFRGFDLIECEGRISALLNCGGFPKAFDPQVLSEFGLLTELDRARTVQRLLREEYPEEHHAQCDVWAIWQMIRCDGES